MSVLSQSISNAFLSRRPSRQHTASLTRLSKSNTGLVYCDPKLAEVDSQVERAIVESENPLAVPTHDEIVLNNERAQWLNKDENLNWRGPIPLEQYRLNVDPEPTLIRKKPKEKIKYKQEVHIKYLKPPTPKPSEIVIVQEPNRQLPPAPPLIIRQAAPRLPTPEPIIIREAPPIIPEPTRRVVHVPGKLLPPPARKVVYEQLPCEPPKPQQVIIERWLKPNIPPPRLIVCKPIQRPPVVYDVVETRCDIPTPPPPQCPCPAECPPPPPPQPVCPPHCVPAPPSIAPTSSLASQQSSLQCDGAQIEVRQENSPFSLGASDDKNDIVISIFIE